MNLEILSHMPPMVLAHTVSAFGALGSGIVMWMRPKGTMSHKILGRVFVVLMLMTAFTALFIRQINDGSFSWIHLFVPLTFFSCWELVHHIRKGNLKKHTHAVRGLFFGALMIPGLLSFLPGRMMWHLAFG